MTLTPKKRYFGFYFKVKKAYYLLIRQYSLVLCSFGIGYFSLGIAKYAKPRQIYAIELNPVSYKYLIENIHINKLTKIITPIHGNCAEEVPKLAEQGIFADRIIMGVFPAPYEYLKNALCVVKPVELAINTNFQTFLEQTSNQESYRYCIVYLNYFVLLFFRLVKYYFYQKAKARKAFRLFFQEYHLMLKY